MIVLAYILLGVIGAGIRILVHIYNYGVAKVKKERALVHLQLGAVGGFLAWTTMAEVETIGYVTALSFGYCAPSIVEHMLKKGEIGTEAVYEP